MNKIVNTNFSFLLKVGSYNEAFEFLLSLSLRDDNYYLEEIGRRFENLGDNLPLYKSKTQRELALKSYNYARTFYIRANVKQRADFLDELFQQDNVYSESIKKSKEKLRKKK